MVKLASLYYSSYGTNYPMAQVAAEAANQVGAQGRLRKVRETAPPEAVNAQPGWKANAVVSDGKRLPEELMPKLRAHRWVRQPAWWAD